ncbi:MAG: hypothetical protein K2Q10_03850 [Rhodospirillales bacterium]|nr:hypothetical protein [Rhodospirillales bacterium]
MSEYSARPFNALQPGLAEHQFHDYLVRKDQVPFMIVNATLKNVRRLVEDFSHDSLSRWDFDPVH